MTGAQMANFVGLAAARHEVLRRTGWDVEINGLVGAPAVRVLAGRERHDAIDRAVRFLGLGTGAIVPVEVDEQGRMLPTALAGQLAEGTGPTIVCAQIGHINTGAVDPVGDICRHARPVGAWVHVDGAFGLWAAASPRLRGLLSGVEFADSWATDAHKWLNVPYDSGLVFCAHPEAHRAAMGLHAAYLPPGNGERDSYDFGPELSRRAGAFPIYASLRTLGREGVARLVDRCCDLARRFAAGLAAAPGVEVLNEVVLNQVLVRFIAGDGDHDGHTRRVIARLQDHGVCWMGGTIWRGQAAMRISVALVKPRADTVPELDRAYPYLRVRELTATAYVDIVAEHGSQRVATLYQGAVGPLALGEPVVLDSVSWRFDPSVIPLIADGIGSGPYRLYGMVRDCRLSNGSACGNSSRRFFFGVPAPIGTSEQGLGAGRGASLELSERAGLTRLELGSGQEAGRSNPAMSDQPIGGVPVRRSVPGLFQAGGGLGRVFFWGAELTEPAATAGPLTGPAQP